MDIFVERPYLPEGRVTLAVGSFAPRGVKLISPPQTAALPEAVRRHADLGFCPLGGNEAVCPPDTYGYYTEALSPYGFSVIRGGQALTSGYPGETAYNIVAVGKYAVLNPKTCDHKLLRLLENRYEIVPVKQGYAKCSVCVVNENAVITADRGIAKALASRGVGVLLISNNGVTLPPYKNGFFGGASGKTDKCTLTVNGSLSKMESGGEIKNFLEKMGIKLMEISSEPPFDTGSIIPLMITANNNESARY